MDEPATQFEQRADDQRHNRSDWWFWGWIAVTFTSLMLWLVGGIELAVIPACVGMIGVFLVSGRHSVLAAMGHYLGRS